MNELQQPILTPAVRRILDGPHLSVLATTDADAKPQTSVIFVKPDGDQILFSTIKGRRKTSNMQRDPRVNLLVHALPVAGPDYATIAGTVEITDDPDGAFHQEMYDIFMGGATPPPEPGAERVIVRLTPDARVRPVLVEATQAPRTQQERSGARRPARPHSLM